jgi:hypothetical protein
MANYDIRTVQGLLGHRSVKTTMICSHVLNRVAEESNVPWIPCDLGTYLMSSCRLSPQVQDLRKVA